MNITLADHVMLATLDDEAVVLNTKSEQYYGLNKTALRMVQVLTESPSRHAACEALRQEFDVESETLTRDLDTLIEGLRSRGLLASSDAA
jgi:hypothetical protein